MDAAQDFRCVGGPSPASIALGMTLALERYAERLVARCRGLRRTLADRPSPAVVRAVTDELRGLIGGHPLLREEIEGQDE